MKNRAAAASLLLSLAGLIQAAPAELKIATWNLEWFMTPETLRALTPACSPPDAPRDGARRAVPCDVAHELARSHEDIAALKRHARALDADVVALQEVDGPEAARLVFPDYRFCFSGRVAVQNNGFAIRRGLPFACAPDLTDLSMSDDVRRGVELRLYPGSAQEMRLLSVHLKSGCARDSLDSSRPSCGELARQVPVLERWIDTAAFGFYSGDHHIHAAGCAHYTSPTEGVMPSDMYLQVKGEGLNVGCLLTWGPCYDFQRQFFEPAPHKLSEPLTLLVAHARETL